MIKEITRDNIEDFNPYYHYIQSLSEERLEALREEFNNAKSKFNGRTVKSLTKKGRERVAGIYQDYRIDLIDQEIVDLAVFRFYINWVRKNISVPQ
jgi:hypothetical protein